MHAAAEALEAEIGYRFRDPELLRRALTHKSSSHEKAETAPSDDNEQLEFLGDSILGFIVSEGLVARYPAFPEGRLSKFKAYLVSASHLYEVANRVRLGDYLILGRGEELSGGRHKKALLANAFEALIAAVYLDGGVDPARALVAGRVLSDFDADRSGADGIDFKSALQELAQELDLPVPHYRVLEERGPEHAKTFVIEACVGSEWSGLAEGHSKKSAGQRAARKVYEDLKRSGPGL